MKYAQYGLMFSNMCINVLSTALPSSQGQHALNWESLASQHFLMYLGGLVGPVVQFFTQPCLQFSLSNGVKRVRVVRSLEKGGSIPYSTAGLQSHKT